MKTLKLFELKKIQTDFPNVKVINSQTGAEFIRNFYSDDIEVFESVFLLLMNRNKMTVGYAKISQGGITGTVIDIKIVAKYALDALASSIILCHNHPSGNEKPSDADIQMTFKIKRALELIECDVDDHIILTKNKYYSMRDEGNLY